MAARREALKAMSDPDAWDHRILKERGMEWVKVSEDQWGKPIWEWVEARQAPQRPFHDSSPQRPPQTRSWHQSPILPCRALKILMAGRPKLLRWLGAPWLVRRSWEVLQVLAS